MKKIFNLVLLASLILPLFLSAKPVSAAPRMDEGIITFADLGLTGDDMVLHGPYDSGTMRFDLPPTWQLKPGGVLELEVTSSFVGDVNLTQDENSLVGATLDVYFNEKLIQSIPLVEGQRVVYSVPIPDVALTPTTSAGWHKLDFVLDAAIDCNLDLHDTTVVVNASSKAIFQYDQIPLVLDLRRLPWPFYQDYRKVADPVIVVIPDSPSAEELQSALVVMGSFARMTAGKLPLNMISVGQLTDDIKAQAHLLMVGKASSLPVLNELSLPVPLDGVGFTSQEGTDEDGVIQEITSPWNEERAILLVSGASDQAVVKSSQALSTLNLQTGTTPDYSIVAEVNPLTSLGIMATDLTQFNSPDVTLSDLGYESETVTGLGVSWQSYEFVIPPGQFPSDSPYLDLNYSVSNLIDPLRSEGVVYMNDIRIGNISLTSETTNLISTRVNIPASTSRPGVNKLDFVLNLVPKDDCSTLAFTNLWFTLYSDSLLHMPLTPVSDISFALQDLSAYPYPFSNDPSLGSTTIVVSQQDFSSWLIAGKIAYDLATRIPGPVLALSLDFDGQAKEEHLANNFVIVGQPKNLTILSGIKDAMPAYFEDGSNIAVLESQQVLYRISDEKDLGYLELFTSPWSDQRIVLGVFGTSPEGLGYAANALLDPESRNQLSGNFATVDGSSVIVVDTRTGLGLGRIGSNPGLPVDVVETAVPTQAVSDAQSAVNNGRQILIASIIGIIVLMGVVVLAVLLLRKRNS